MRLCRDPLGELERSPDSLVAIGEGVLHTKGKGDGRGWRGEKGREGIASSLYNFWLQA